MVRKNTAAFLFVGMPLFLFTVLITACQVVDVHPYDAKIYGPTQINSKNIATIESTMLNKREFTFAFISDTQRWYDDTRDVVTVLNNNTPDFVIHGGDLADFGATREFMWQRDILNRLKVPYVCVIGNHDCLGSGEYVFRKVFGIENFSFVAGDVLFVCMNTNAMEFDYSKPIPDFDFMEHLLDNIPPNVKRTVFVMHARPSCDQFNNNVAKVFEHYVCMFPNVMFCLNGHDHKLNIEDIFSDGLIYYGCPNINKRQYFLFTVKEDGYSYEIKDF